MAWYSLSEVLKIKPPTDEKSLKRLWMRPRPSKKITKPKSSEKKAEVSVEIKKGRIDIYV
ncbi:MAG TPA: hypothetical protein DEP48_05635 [Persephonella sp.]|uniref:Uncharacterized protein n=1 Tax=Persephonella marina (strain DSM 14350 / EX-H1) TaxID=123214 RepID=C0QPG6_PERMH|nr:MULTISPECIES: hypothetical protein [Persephonella]ACO04349.1 hypothetical protein PERMA_0776 [Persephonella marina EX-H1]HCB69823.1 hypothetical protein [Persephonella sp.]